MDECEERTFQGRGGMTIVVRHVQPADRALFVEGQAYLSADTWRARFLMSRDHLEEAELDYLTHPDGLRHVALGACRRDVVGKEHPVAVARYLLIPDEDGIAECAIVVVDEYQGRGFGRIMAQALLDAARQRGVKEFRCEVFADNLRMLHLIRRLVPASTSHLVGSLLHIRVPIADSEEGA
jgi:RimJ/RimL family protein N-acetyltransferase